MNFLLTIAASDNSGGAGIQQDVKIADNLNYWALSAITGITVQNFKTAYEIEPVKPELLDSQIKQSFLSFPVKSVKIGAISSYENLKVIIDTLNRFSPDKVVLDTVLSSTSGLKLIDEVSVKTMKEKLFPLTTLITPNKNEFNLLCNAEIKTIEEGISIAEKKSKEWNTAILLKGGHFNSKKINEAIISENEVFCFERDRLEFNYSHGTGCALSTAVACFLGNGLSLTQAYEKASDFIIKYYSELQFKLKIND